MFKWPRASELGSNDYFTRGCVGVPDFTGCHDSKEAVRWVVRAVVKSKDGVQDVTLSVYRDKAFSRFKDDGVV
jgi:hypothetical protein